MAASGTAPNGLRAALLAALTLSGCASDGAAKRGESDLAVVAAPRAAMPLRYRGQPLEFWLDEAGPRVANLAPSEEFGEACVVRTDALAAFAPVDARARDEFLALLHDRSDTVRAIVSSGLREAPANVRAHLTPALVAQLQVPELRPDALSLLVDWDLDFCDGAALRSALARHPVPAIVEAPLDPLESSMSDFTSEADDLLRDLREWEKDEPQARGNADWMRRWSLAHLLIQAGAAESRWTSAADFETALEVLAAVEVAADAAFEARVVEALRHEIAAPTRDARWRLIGALRYLPPRMHSAITPSLVDVLADQEVGVTALALLVDWARSAAPAPRRLAALRDPAGTFDPELAEPLARAAWEFVSAEGAPLERYEFGHRLAEASITLQGRDDADALDTLALALYRLGRVDEALRVQVEAIEKLAPGREQKAIDFETRLQRYRSSR